MSIGALARRTGLASSAIRYYEERRLLPPPERRAGRRLYDEAAVARLAAIRFAKEAGFSLSEIEELVRRFGDARWRSLAERKLRQIDEAAARLRVAREMLRGVIACGCFDLEECGRRLLAAAPRARRLTSLPREDDPRTSRARRSQGRSPRCIPSGS